MTFLRCSSCGKANVVEARYCIGCGAILTPVYCSSCGTANPDGLEQCLECGNSLPNMTGITWNPIVTVLQPTSAMNPEVQSTPELPLERAEHPETSSKQISKWLRKKLRL